MEQAWEGVGGRGSHHRKLGGGLGHTDSRGKGKRLGPDSFTTCPSTAACSAAAVGGEGP